MSRSKSNLPNLGEGSGESTCLSDPPSGRSKRDEERALAQACVDSRPGAWARFAERYTPLITIVARRTLKGRGLRPSDEDLEDIVENTFVALVKDDFRLLGTYDDTYALSTFLGVIARTHAGRYVRRKRHRTSSIDKVELRGSEPDPATHAERNDTQQLVRDTLEQLSPRDRKILQLFYFSNVDYQGIATELGVRPNSVGAALHRARTRLKAKLESRRHA